MGQKDIALILSFTDKGTAVVKKVVGTTKKELSKLEQSAKKTGKGFDTMQSHAEKSMKGMSKLKTAFKSTAMQMAAGMGIMVGVQGVIQGIRKAITSLINTGREFEREWANVTTMLDESKYSSQDMKWELISMSPVLGDTTDLARGMYQVLSASVAPSKAIMFLGEAAKSAQAGVTSVHTAVDALTTVINAYGMAAEDVTAVSDIMFQAVMRGKMTYEGMAGALGTVAPIAAQVGVTFEEIAAAMATLTRQGVDVNTTTMQLRQVMVSVLKPTSEAATLAANLGIEFNATALKTKGLSGFLAEVQEKTGGSADKMSLLFGNVRALTGVMGLAGKSAADFKIDLKLMANASGATEVAFQKQMKSADFWIKTMVNTIKKFAVSFFQGLVSPFTKGIKSSKQLDATVKRMVQDLKMFGTVVGNIVKYSLGPFVMLLKDLITFGGQIPYEEMELMMEFIRQQETAISDAQTRLEGYNKEIEEHGTVTSHMSQTAANDIKNYGNITMRTVKEVEKSIDDAKESGVNFMESVKIIMPAVGSDVGEVTAAAKLLQQAFEDLKIETKVGLNTAFDTLQNQIVALIESDLVFTETLKPQLKKLEALGQITGQQVSPQLRLLMGDYNVLAEEAGTFNVELSGSIPRLVGVKESMIQLEAILNDTAATGGHFIMMLGHMVPYLHSIARMVLENRAQAQLLGITWQTDLVENAKKVVTAFEDYKAKGELAKSSTEDQETAIINFVRAADILGIKVPKNYRDIADAAAESGESTADIWDRVTEDITRTWTQGLAEIFAGTSSMADLINNSWSLLATGIGSTVGNLVGDALSSIGGLAGPIGGIIGGLAGGLVNLVGGFLGIKSKAQKEAEAAEEAQRKLEEQVRKTASSFQDLGMISEDVAGRFVEMSQSVGRYRAELLFLPDLMEETGINMHNLAAYGERLADVIYGIQNRTLDMSAGMEVASQAWGTFIEGVQILGQEGTPAVVDFLNVVRDLGISIQEVDSYVYEWLRSASEGLSKMVGGATNATDEMARLGDLSVAVFEGFLSQGQDYTKTLDTMLEPLTALKLKYDELGIAGSDAINRLLEIGQLRETYAELFEAIDANKQVLQALGNTGFLTASTLNDIAQQVELYYSQLQTLGFTTTEALTTMVPTFTKLEHYAEAYDYQLSAGVQTLIDQAREQGILKDSFIDTISQGVDSIVDAIEEVVDAIHEGREDGAIQAQHGFHGEVIGPQTFQIEPGMREQVDISPVGSSGSGEDKQQVIVVQNELQPVLIPWSDMEGWILELIQDRFEGENLLTPTRSVRGRG